MLFWIFVIITVIGAVVWWFNKDDCGYDFDFGTFGACIFWIGLMAVVISNICFMCEYGLVDSYTASKQVEYESLVYRYENDIYDNDVMNDYAKQDVIAEIQEWNKFVASYREHQDNFWIGIYYANIYDQFELIELESVDD